MFNATEGSLSWAAHHLLSSDSFTSEREDWSYFSFLSSEGLQLTLFSHSKRVQDHFGSRRHRHFKVRSVLMDLWDALDVFAFLDLIIRQPCTNTFDRFTSFISKLKQCKVEQCVIKGQINQGYTS